MPLPKPNTGESKNDFISRCMGDDAMNSEYPDQAQRAAVCNSQWKEYSEFQPSETYDINDVEIFSSGKWNGDEYSENDLDDMVTAFGELTNEIKPYLKLGHDDKQSLLQKDGLPSAGWITNLKRVGDKLVADFKGIPKKIKELIEKKAYGRFSSEIYWDLKQGGKKYRRVLKAVALLGADTPAVQNLNDFINLYIENNLEYESEKNYHELENNMEDKNYEFLEGQVKKYEDEIKSYKVQIDTLESEKEDLQGQVKKLTQDIETKKTEQKEKDIKLFIDQQVEAKKILPSQVEKYTELARKDFESVQDVIKNMPELSIVDEGKTQHTEKPKKYSAMTDEEKEDFAIAKAYEYMKENKEVTFKDAYLIVSEQLEKGE